MPTDLDAERVKLAEERVRGFLNGATNADLDDYLKVVAAMPALIRTSGLGQSMAFLAFKDKTAHQRVYKDFEACLGRFLMGSDEAGSFDVLLADSDRLHRAATREVLAFSQWLKQIAEIHIGKSEGEEGGADD